MVLKEKLLLFIKNLYYDIKIISYTQTKKKPINRYIDVSIKENKLKDYHIHIYLTNM
jgi:hypothetical protein